MNAEAEPGRRRRRPAVSCALCRRRKLRCNREFPCSNCTKSKTGNAAETCVYDEYYAPNRRHASKPAHGSTRGAAIGPSEDARRLQISAPAQANIPDPKISEVPTAAPAPSASNPSVSPSQEVEMIKNRVLDFNKELFKSTEVHSSRATVEKITSDISGTFYIQSESRGMSSDHQAITCSVVHKGRVFGQSHWFSSGMLLFRDILDLIEPHVTQIPHVISTIQRCKALAKVIKTCRTPSWPTPPTSTLPPKPIADELINNYLRTSESIHRVLHIPTFLHHSESLWTSPPDPAFLIQLKLVLAIGAATYDETFSLRPSAVQWVYEAQTYLSHPDSKSLLTIHALKTHLLLLLAREAAGVNEGMNWVSAGTLLRTAVYMGLHRDPANLMNTGTLLTTEMHRRLWNSILELCLQSSLTSGGPPLFSLSDFDTQPPSNFDDNQLTSTTTNQPQPFTVPTQSSTAIALRRTLTARLAIVKFLNDLSSPTSYAEALRLDSALRAAYTLLPALPTTTSIHIELIMHTYLSALHVPFFPLSLQARDQTYAFTRTVVIDTSLQIWYAVNPPPSTSSPPSRPTPSPSSSPPASSSPPPSLPLLTKNTSTPLRTAAMQSLLLIALSLHSQLLSLSRSPSPTPSTLGTPPLRRDLLAALDAAQPWQLSCLEAGETNMKGYLLLGMLCAHIGGLRSGLDKAERTRRILTAVENAGVVCLEVFERIVAGLDGGVGEAGGPGMQGAEEDWDSFTPDSLFDFGFGDPMIWGFEGPGYDGGLQEPVFY
ncbi:hypothetical protein B0T22DRAFT_405080 [Podospora appendiculata]|uniref:Zn(2)-C6 fungal-type domain-containing protein n=1 Tax=Podospora appendiculata TaxID=314037 RepID=A0AAE0XDB0_9PEZI|nr:hypothetical protein B0T22DRAFT_405080 [Podospora appendiculata]